MSIVSSDPYPTTQEGPTAAPAERIYVHGGRVDEIVASAAGGTWHHHHYDARGHCILLTDTGGNILEQYDYDAFGRPYFYDRWGNDVGSSFLGNQFLFTGREWIKDMRLYDYRHRMYQPELGRFIQPDPKQFAAGDYNLYRYCHNDPVNRVDPTGLQDAKPVTVEIEKIRRTAIGSHIPHWITNVKILFTALARAANGDKTDRTETLYKDGGHSSIAAARFAERTWKGGQFVQDKKVEEVPVAQGREVGLMLHFHVDVRPSNSTTQPSVPGADANAVIENQAAMLYSATSLYKAQRGVLITPNGQRQPTETPVYLNW